VAMVAVDSMAAAVAVSMAAADTVVVGIARLLRGGRPDMGVPIERAAHVSFRGPHYLMLCDRG
jgi:hypothetical protein